MKQASIILMITGMIGIMLGVVMKIMHWTSYGNIIIIITQVIGLVGVILYYKKK